MNSLTNDIAARLATWSSALDAGAIPADAAASAVRCIVDATGVGLAAIDRPVAAAALRIALDTCAPGDCSLIGRRETLSALGAAQVNATAIHALDFDDTSYAGTLHGTAVIWPATLAAAEMAGATGADTLAAFVAGSEVAYALGQDLGNAIYDRGWWTTPLLGAIGAAAGAARALRLDLPRTRHAIALATAQAFGTRAVMGSAAKPYLCGQAAASGLRAALAAREGIDGPFEVLEAGFGFARLTGETGLNWRAVGGIGARYALVDPGIAFKQYPVCSSAQAAAEAIAAIRSEVTLDPDAVAEDACGVTPMVAQCLPYGRPGSVTEAQFSMPFAVGCMLVFGELTPGQLNDRVLADPRLRRVMGKVTMTVDPALGVTPADRRDRPEATAVTIATTDGRRRDRRIDAATGMPTNPMPDSLLNAKFALCARNALSPAAADAMGLRLRNLVLLPSIRDLFAPLHERPIHAQASIRP